MFFHNRFVLGFVLLSFTSAYSQEPVFTGNVSVTYAEAISAYQRLADAHSAATLHEIGSTDVGRPPHVFVIDKGGKGFDPALSNRSVLLINNGIHPGEPCGIDASIQLAERLLSARAPYSAWLDSVVVAIIPVYNVGGALRRGCCVRANQNGPDEYGFRGNARNLDLNRDFIKADSENAKAFYRIFHWVKPHVVIDTHTSNGADYQYVMTMINTQPDKAGEAQGAYMRETMNPDVYARMEQAGFGMTPYVFSMGVTPETGLRDYLETPRYTTGYAALFNAIGYTSETHMLKPFAQRVESTYQFLRATLEHMHANNRALIELRRASDRQVETQKTFAIDWELDTTQFRMIPFRGYEAHYPKSKIHGESRLAYDRSRPFEREIRYYDRYKVTREVQAPVAYIVPQAWREVIERFKLNGVLMERLERDTVVELEVYYIREFTSSNGVYEGHHLNTVNALEVQNEAVQLFAGDYVVYVNQVSNRYIVETLEPQAVDAFFRWNFFDSVLQQKEWYSDYVFEDTAADLLAENAALRAEFEAAKASDADLAASPKRQLFWIYLRSPFYEGTVNRYPVFRMVDNMELR